LLLVANKELLQLSETDEIGEYCKSGPYLYYIGGRMLAASLAYFIKFHALDVPSSIPAKIKSDTFEKIKDLTEAVPMTY
jgi:hypothetical protein